MAEADGQTAWASYSKALINKIPRSFFIVALTLARAVSIVHAYILNAFVGGLFMCDSKKGCQRPEELKGKPEECSPEQIKKCHGDSAGHPCAEPSKDEHAD